MSEIAEHAPGTPSWVDLATTDADGALGFYCTLFGWTAEDVGGEAGGHYTMLRKNGKDVAALYASVADQSISRWNTYITVADCDAAARRVEFAGGTVFAAPFDVSGSGRMTVVQDPTGALLALWEPRGHSGARLVNEPGSLCWNELITPNRDRAAAFYGALFGWSSRTYQLGPVAYTEFRRGPHRVAGMTEMSGVAPYWNVSFAVADAAETLEAVECLGGRTVRPVTTFPFGRIASFADPHGATFSIVEQTDGAGPVA